MVERHVIGWQGVFWGISSFVVSCEWINNTVAKQCGCIFLEYKWFYSIIQQVMCDIVKAWRFAIGISECLLQVSQVSCKSCHCGSSISLLDSLIFLIQVVLPLLIFSSLQILHQNDSISSKAGTCSTFYGCFPIS